MTTTAAERAGDPDRGTVLVVGGGRGIGAAIAESYGARGRVWTRSSGVDATDGASVRAAWEGLDELPFGVVHCVGDFLEKPALDTTEAEWRDLFDSNVVSAFQVARIAAPDLARAGRGRIVFMAAAGVEAPVAKTRAPAYFAANAALVSFARSLAMELSGSGVMVHTVAPGLIEHQHSHRDSQLRMASRVPLGRTGAPRDVVGVVQHLLNPATSYTSGGIWTVDGGLSL